MYLWGDGGMRGGDGRSLSIGKCFDRGLFEGRGSRVSGSRELNLVTLQTLLSKIYNGSPLAPANNTS